MILRDELFSRFINKALRTDNVDVCDEFRFFIIDLSEQLEMKFKQLKEKQKDVLTLYRGLKLSHEEIQSFQRKIANWIIGGKEREVQLDFLLE